MAKNAHAGGVVNTVKMTVKSDHSSNSELKVGVGPKANAMSPVGKKVGYEAHGKKAGTIGKC